MQQTNGSWTDLIHDFMDLTAGAVSPDLFRRWSAVSMIAGALERRVWAKVGDYQTFANLYILLVAPPGVGKKIIETVQELWSETAEAGTKSSPVFHISPDSVTKASLLDSLAEARRTFLPPEGPLLTYHSLLVAASEFEVLLPAYDKEFISNLNKIYDNLEMPYREKRRTGNVRSLSIEKAQLNILAGAQPAYFAGTFPEEAWNTGLARRIIMIYSSEVPFKELFEESPNLEAQRQLVLEKLQYLSGLHGAFHWTPEAAEHLKDWHRSGAGKGGPPIPSHSKLEAYSRSRTMHVIKLTMVSAIARTGHLIIELLDVRRAIVWLLEVEALMPDIFRAMVGRSDAQVIEEMHYFVQAQWARGRQAAVSGDSIRRFLISRVPSDKIEGLLLVADRANIIARVAGTADDWVPRPRHEYEVE